MIDLATTKFCIWGYKEPTHTNHWPHYGFYRALKHLGAHVSWLNGAGSPEFENTDFSNTLFITEGQVSSEIPIRDDCFYVTMNDSVKYPDGRRLCLQVYTDDCLKYKLEKLSECVYFAGDGLFQPWATDLLPHEVEANKPKELKVLQGNHITFVGSAGGAGTMFGNYDELMEWKRACDANGITFEWKGLWAEGVGKVVEQEESIRVIKESYMAPAIAGLWNQKHGYIQCRIFKNISYGQFGITNCFAAAKLFGKFSLDDLGVVYNSNTYQLFYDAREYISKATLKDLHRQMDEVKNKHTYINRIQTIIQCANRVLGEK